MIERAFLGTVSFKIDGFDISLMTDRLRKACKVISLYTKGDSIYLSTFGNYEKKITKLCEDSDCICEILQRKGAVFTLKKYIRRFGIYFGALAAAVLVFILSNTVMKIEIKGTEDEKLIGEIRSILREEGVHPGSYIPSLNCLKLSNAVFTRSDGIAWASVGTSGSVVCVDVTEMTRPIDAEKTRIPCNIVADRDCVITDAEVMVGRLDVLIGDAVYKGQMLVSGVIDHPGVSTKYYHAYAKIRGRYEESASFFQPYIDEKSAEGRVLYRRTLKFFELSLPLFGDVLESGREYAVESSKVDLKFFGIKLPVSVVTYRYTEIDRSTETYTAAEAYAELLRRVRNYESNILKDRVIIDRKISETATEDGVGLNVLYTLEGEVGTQSEIFIK